MGWEYKAATHRVRQRKQTISLGDMERLLHQEDNRQHTGGTM
jgi:hypothetical protein